MTLSSNNDLGVVASGIDVKGLKAAIAVYEGGGSPEQIEHIETHISHVFLTKAFAYKLKKSVRFDFLDFSTFERRRQACEKEVELNKRTAPDVYLGVVDICRTPDGRLILGGDEGVVDSVVKMRRLPSTLMMDEKIAINDVREADISALIDVLDKFYRETKRIHPDPATFVNSLRNEILANFVELGRDVHCLDQDLLRRIRNRQLQFLELNSDLWVARIKSGLIVDGHGDLRPEHICLEDIPKIFDCVEFNDGFRQVDLLDEICFFALECERLGRRDIGTTLLQSKLTDYRLGHNSDLADFFMSYRATVRAKVAVLRMEQTAGDDQRRALILAKRYLDLADRGMGPMSRPFCVIVRGLVGSGKSTVSKKLSERLGMTLIQSDRVRREQNIRSEAGEAYGEGVYSLSGRLHIYEKMLETAVSALRNRTSVILDACYLQKDVQQRVLYQVDALGVELVIINCECPQEVAVSRVLERMKDPSCLSDARPEHWLDQARDDEGMISGAHVLNIRTSSSGPDQLCDQIIAYLRSLAMNLDPSSSRVGSGSYWDTSAEVRRSFDTSRLATLARV